MKRLYGAVFALALMAATPIWASTTTIWGGFEDTTGSGSDYDYNDIVFSITGTNLTLHSGGIWHSPSGLTLGTSGSPFWNNASFDGPNDNVGYCIYGGPSGSCGGHSAGFDPGADYLATAGGGSVTNVYFSVGSGGVDPSIVVSISADTDTLGWALLSSPSVVNAITSGTPFSPTGNFELVGIVNGGTKYYSDADTSKSQFAWFETAPTPEPGSLMLLGSGLLGIAGVARRRFSRN